MILNRKHLGSELICDALERLGVRHVFGVPGSHNIALFEALRRSNLRTILSSHEAGAGFMANGHYRASRQIAALLTVSGPGFTNAITALAEAREDSAALLYLVNVPSQAKQKFQLHALDHEGIAGSVVKQVFTIRKAEEAAAVLFDAYSLALAGEPGPVIVQVADKAMVESCEISEARLERLAVPSAANNADAKTIENVIALLKESVRPVVYAGMGCHPAADQLRQFAEFASAPVIMTRSGCGVLPMDHPLAITFESNETGAAACNKILTAADLILVLGCKLSHNGSAGFLLQFPAERTIHVDTSKEVLEANYPVRLAVRQDVTAFLSAILTRKDEFSRADRAWHDKDLQDFKDSRSQTAIEPDFPTVPEQNARWLFHTLRSVLPRDAILVTDSGLHQVLTFRYWQSCVPGGIIAPTDFQSMGFGIPAAIGAKLACPEREVVAIVGDGGFAMSGMELLTAVREKIGLTVFVFTDGALGQIRLQQLLRYGASHGTALTNPDLAAFALAIGAGYLRVDKDLQTALHDRKTSNVTIVEVPVSDSKAIQLMRAKGAIRRIAEDMVGSTTLSRLKSALKPAK